MNWKQRFMALSLCNLFFIQRIAGRHIDIDHTTILQHPKRKLLISNCLRSEGFYL